MKQKSAQYVFFISLSLVVYFLLTISIYYVSLSLGNKGINISLFGGGDDGVGYYNEALKYSYGSPYNASSIIVILFGMIFKIFNTENVIILRLFNYSGYVLLVITSLLLLKKILTYKYQFYQISILLILLLMIYPSLILNTTLSIYRDIWIYFFFIWSIYLFSNIFILKSKYPKSINIILLVFSMLMLFGFRRYALMSFLIGASIYLIVTFNKKKKMNLKKASLVIVGGFSIFYLFFKDLKMPFVNLSFSDVLAYRQSFIDIYSGGSQMNISLEQSNLVLFYLNYVYSFFSNIIGPFPWQVNSFATLAIMLTEGILFLIIVLVLLRNRKSFNNLDKFLIIQSIVWFMLISLSNDNFGASSRLRIMGWIPLMILFVKYVGENIYMKKRCLK